MIKSLIFLLALTGFAIGCKPETSAKLDALPESVAFKGNLEKVRYDASKKSLIVKGDLTTVDYTALVSLSGDFAYRRAVDKLYEWTNKEETSSKGHLTVLADPAVQPLMRQIKQNFLSGKPEATLDIYPESSRNALLAVTNEETRFAVILGGIKPSENQNALKVSAQLSRFGRDAICFIVNPKNPISELRLSQAADILSGKVSKWSDVGGAPINLKLLLPLEEDGRREYLQDTLGISLTSRAETIVTEAQLLEQVFKDSSTIGLTSMATALPYLQADEKLRDTTRFKVLAIRANEQGASSVTPYQAFVAQGKYPLAYDIYAFFRTNLGNYPSGFSAFLNSGDENQGQAILLVMGLVPTRVRIQLTK